MARVDCAIGHVRCVCAVEVSSHLVHGAKRATHHGVMSVMRMVRSKRFRAVLSPRCSERPVTSSLAVVGVHLITWAYAAQRIVQAAGLHIEVTEITVRLAKCV